MFDYQGAIDAGYSDSDIIDHLLPNRAFDIEGARNAGYSDEAIARHLSTMSVSGVEVEEPEEESQGWVEQYIFNPIDKGWNMLELSANIIGAETGLLEKEKAAEYIAANVQDIASIQQGEEVAEGLAEIQEAEGFWDSLEAVVTNPAAVIDVTISSLVSSIPALAGFVIGTAGGAAVVGQREQLRFLLLEQLEAGR